MSDDSVTLEQIEEAAKRAGCETDMLDVIHVSGRRIAKVTIDGFLMYAVPDRAADRYKRTVLRILNALAREREEREQVRPEGSVSECVICGCDECGNDISITHSASAVEDFARQLGGRVVWGCK